MAPTGMRLRVVMEISVGRTGETLYVTEDGQVWRKNTHDQSRDWMSQLGNAGLALALALAFAMA